MWGKSCVVVKAGTRVLALEDLLVRAGFEPLADKPPAPHLQDLPEKRIAEIMDLYRALGGSRLQPNLRPGPWDLALQGGVVVELDEEPNFNRYRRLTLEPDWAEPLPWRDDYLRYTLDGEGDCLASAASGRRWTNTSCEALFGVADPPGTFDSGGAPRWKQRALYDAIKDAAALSSPDLHLARLAIADNVGGVPLGRALEGRGAVDVDALSRLVAQRTT
jgi:hypothetical protein